MANSLSLIALSFAFFLTNVISPQLGFVLTFVSPFFFVNYLNSPDRLKNTDIIAVIAVLSTAIYSPLVPIYFGLIVATPSILILLHHKGKFHTNPLVAAPIPLLTVTTLILVFFTGYKSDLINTLVQNIEMVTSAISPDILLTEQGAKLVYIKNNAQHIATTIVHLLPGTSFAYVALVTFSTNRYFYKKNKLEPSPFKVPDKLFIPLIAGGFLILIDGATSQIIAYNTLIVFASLFFMQGLEVLNSLFQRYNISVFLRMIVYILLFSEPFIMLALCAVGLADNWIDFNKRLKIPDDGSDSKD